jgi:hypothetical protein
MVLKFYTTQFNSLFVHNFLYHRHLVNPLEIILSIRPNKGLRNSYLSCFNSFPGKFRFYTILYQIVKIFVASRFQKKKKILFESIRLDLTNFLLENLKKIQF